MTSSDSPLHARALEALRRGRLPVPASLVQAIEDLSSVLPEELLNSWLQVAGELESLSPELSVQYLRDGIHLLQSAGEDSFRAWVTATRSLPPLDLETARPLFAACHSMAASLPAEQVDDWSRSGAGLAGKTAKARTLALRFLVLSPELERKLSYEGLSRLALVLRRVSGHSAGHADACLDAVLAACEKLNGEEVNALLDFGRAILETAWLEIVPYFQRAPDLLLSIEPFQRGHFLQLCTQTAPRLKGRAFRSFVEAALAIKDVRLAYHGRLIELAEAILPFSAAAAISFLKNGPYLLSRLSLDELGTWHAAGISTFIETGSGGDAFFALELARAQELLAVVGARVDLSGAIHVLNLYAKALTGLDLAILPASALTEKGIGWVDEEEASTDGKTIYLPGHFDRFAGRSDNFGAYKALVTHQTGHIEFGSFGFSFDRPARVFTDRRPEVEGLRSAGDPLTGTGSLTDMERFYDLFPDRRLACDLFRIAEDLRIDCCIQSEYTGLETIGKRLKQAELKRRPNTFFLALRQAFVENVLRASLDGPISAGWPRPLSPLLDQALQVLEALRTPGATVEDAAEAALLLYDLAMQVPNLPPGEGGYIDWMSAVEVEEETSLTRHQFEGISGREVPYESIAAVDHYGDFKPEMVQLLLRLRSSDPGEPVATDRDSLRELLQKSAEVSFGADGDLEQLVESLEREAAPASDAASDDLPAPVRSTAVAPGARTFFYKEWDFRAGDYRPRWCRILERPLEEAADAGFFQQAVAAHAGLVRATQRQFELLKAEPFRKIKRLEEGEDFDLDCLIEFLGQKRAGSGESAKVYWRRNKTDRQVAVALLLDMSSSTEARIDEQRWPPQRIVDLERESLVLLSGALEVIGDRYAIFGFSGSGRQNVAYFVIKDFGEGLNETVKRRMGAIEPMDATRMGAAIRHTTSRLQDVDARTRLLFLISDGRPQDVDYGGQPADREYAIHDTHMALLEARQRGITPFAVTVDKDGHEYLGQMCGDLAYEVIDKIELLPERLPALYRRLTE